MKNFKIEQVNPNDEEFQIIEIHFKEGSSVVKDDIILTVEGQKTSFDVVAENNGIIHFYYLKEDFFNVDDYVYAIFENKESYNQHFSQQNSVIKSDLESDVSSSFKTKVELKNVLVEPLSRSLVSPQIRLGVLFGGKALRQIEDALHNSVQMKIVSVFDDEIIKNHKYAGDTSCDNLLLKARESNIDVFFIATGNAKLRARTYNRLKKLNLRLINIIHPTAIISNNAVIGDNVFIGPSVIISSKAYVDSACFISALANIEHHCIVGENTLIGPGVSLSGSVKIGKNSVISAGVSVESNVSIGESVFITSGKGINRNISDNERVL